MFIMYTSSGWIERLGNGKWVTYMKIVARVRNFLGQAPTRKNTNR